MRPSLAAGAELAHYRVHSLIGRGGMGSVYLAEDLRLDRRVALKVLTPELSEDPEFRKRFVRESQMAASVEHPNIVPVYEADEGGGLLFIAMRYVDGIDLRTLLRSNGSLSPDAAVGILVQVASALDAAHRSGLVHRDVKPANVLLAESTGPAPHVYLSDFGLSKRTEGSADLSRTGQFLGTIDYSAPEQIDGRPVDARTDLYALGCVAFQCLTGKVPFDREVEMAVLWAHLQEPPPRASELLPTLPTAVDDVLARSMAKAPEDRFRSAGEFVGGLAVALRGERPPLPTPAPVDISTRPRTETSPEASVRKVVTVVACGIDAVLKGEGSPDPERQQPILAMAEEEIRAIIQKYRGTPQPALGEGTLGVFGVPIIREDDAARALGAVSEIQRALTSLSAASEEVSLTYGIGVATGEVLVTRSQPGGPRLAGSAVTAAMKLQHAATPGQVWLADSTWRLTREAVDSDPAGEHGGIRAHRFVELRSETTVVRRFSAPMIGRDRPLLLLEQAFEAVATDRRCSLFTVLGQAGVGKSRLVSEFLNGLNVEATVLRGRCLSFGEGITYWPIMEILRQSSSLPDSLEIPDLRREIERTLEGEPEADRIAETLAGLLGAGPMAPVQETFWAVRRLLEHLALRRPVVVVMEDLHWAEPTLLDLVEHVADLSTESPILLIGTARPELLEDRPGWGGGKLSAIAVSLEPLSDTDSEQLIELLLGGAGLAPAARSSIAKAAEGNPLFLEEFLGMLVEDGVLVGQGESWRVTRDLSQLSVPPTISALMAAMVDRLRPDERAIVDRAAVEGTVFHMGAIEWLGIPVDAEPVTAALLSLVRKDMIRRAEPELPGQSAYRFRHQLIRDAAYQSVPKARRADWHELLAAWLEGTAGERRAEYEEIVGYHLEQACRFRVELGLADDRTEIGGKASALLAGSGRRAAARGDAPAAANLLLRAAALLPHGDRDRLAQLAAACASLTEAGDLDAAKRVATDASQEANATSDELAIARARIAHLLVRRLSDPEGWFETAARDAERLKPVFTAAGDHWGLSQVLFVQALSQQLFDMDAAAKVLEQSAREARLADPPDLARYAWCLSYTTGSAFNGEMRADEGIMFCRNMLEKTEGSKAAEANTLANLAGLLAMRGGFAEGRMLLARSETLFEELGLKSESATAVVRGAFLEMLAGDPPRAERRLRRGQAVLRAIGERWYLGTVDPLLAHVLWAEGRHDEAEEAATEASLSVVQDDLEGQWLWRAALAKTLARRGDGRGEDLSREAVTITEAMHSPNQLGDALMDLAEVLRLLGRPEEGARSTERAAALYAKKGNVVSEQKARTMIQDSD